MSKLVETYTVVQVEMFKRLDLEPEAAKWLVPHCGEAHDICTFNDSKDAHIYARKLRHENKRDHFVVTINYPSASKINRITTVNQLAWNDLVIYWPKGDEDRPQLCAVNNERRFQVPDGKTMLIGLVSGMYWYPEDNELVQIIDRKRVSNLLRGIEKEVGYDSE